MSQWNITEKKAPCPACCEGTPGNAWFNLCIKTDFPTETFVWKCRNCGWSVNAEGIEPGDDRGTGIVDAYRLDENGHIEEN